MPPPHPPLPGGAPGDGQPAQSIMGTSGARGGLAPDGSRSAFCCRMGGLSAVLGVPEESGVG